MKKQVKSLRRIGAWTLAAAMILGIALPAVPKTVKAAETQVTGVNYAPGGTATVSDQETDYWGADKAIDGIVNRDAEKADQSRWSTNQNVEAPCLKVDLGSERTFNRFVIEWERTNVTGFTIETSNTGNDNDWTEVYSKSDSTYVNSASEIELENPATARYVRLTITDYTGNAQPDDGITWKSISVYEFKIIANVDVVGEEILKNLSLDAVVTADSSEADSVAAAKANDGNQSTHWGSGVGAASEENPHWLQLTWDAPQTIQTIKIHWERPNTTAYSLQTSEDGNTWTDILKFTEAPADYWQTIELDAPLTTQYLRVNVTAFNPTGAPEGGTSVTWATVGVCEFETYSYAGILETEEELTLQDVVDGLAAPEVNEAGTAVTLPAVDGYTVELLADYEQVVGRDGTIYKPLTQKTVKAIYKVTQGEGEDAESVEGTNEYTLTIPGQYDNAGENEKPVVIPELAEWYGETGNLTIKDGSTIYVADSAFTAAAQSLADDYNAEMGTHLTVESGDTAVSDGDILFTVDENSGLGEEGYIMEIGDTLTVKAEESTGAYWATRSILQIAELNNGSIPKGITKDYPKYEVRGFMLDVARKPIAMETLQNIAKEMAYYKMNEFHIHLNDNLIFYEDYASAAEARELAYTGFRLESDVVEGGNEGINQADLTNKDLYYTKEEFRDFILSSRSMGVNITPEFDTPGHSGAFTKVRPDLMLQNIVSGAAKRAGEQFDLSEEKYDESLAFVESIWDEYLNEDMFDQSMTVHIGTDEYYGEANRFRMFSDDLIEYIQSKGYTVRLWGSLSSLTGEQDVRSEGVQMNVWNTGWANPKNMYNEGFELINTIDGQLYMVPAAGYYYDYLNTQNLYNNWVPNNFSGTTIPAGSDQMLGSTYAIWNDSVDTRANGISEIDIYDRFADAVPTMASKNWGEGKDLEYAEMEAVVEQLGDAANSNPYYEASADDNGEYMSYEFDDTTDSSANGRDLSEPVNAEITDGTLRLSGGESYVTTPVDKLATGNTLEFDITLEKPAQAGDILFEADNEGSNGDYVHDIRIMDDGRLGFRRELYDYYFDYKLPVGETVHLAISTSGTTTTLTVNGTTYEASGVYRNRQTDGEVRKENISRATLLLPLQRIGSETNAIEAVIDNVTVKQGGAVDYNKDAWTKVKVDSETNMNSTTEGLFEYAFDGNSGTIWHSNWKGASDKVDSINGAEGNKDVIAGEINLGQKYKINQFKFTPRTGTASGQVTKADLYVKANEADEWTQVAEDEEFAADSTTKTFYFDEQEVQFVRFVAKQSNDGWVAVSEFDIANAPEQSWTVYVDAQEGGTASGGETEIADNAEVTVVAVADTGYIFAGWYDAVTETQVSDAAEYTFNVTENTALRAYFTKNDEPESESYTVTIDGEPQTVKDGEKATRPETDPTKAGHKFLGWFEDGSDTAFDFEQPVTGDVTLTARFQAYTVAATADSGVTVSEMDDQGQVTVTAPEKDGYNFTGWLVNGTKVSAGLSYTFVPEADTTVEPVYEQIIPDKTYYDVIINGQPMRVEENTVLSRPTTDPVKDGYRFIGWYVGDKEYDFSQPVTSDLVIEARFEKITTPVEPENPDDQKPGSDTQKPESGKTDKDEDKAVKTGDVSDFAPWILFLVISAGAVVVLARRKTNK